MEFPGHGICIFAMDSSKDSMSSGGGDNVSNGLDRGKYGLLGMG